MDSTRIHEDVSTPENNTQRRTVTITHAQKQALIDNLQVEITERARKLRAQSALQAQGLRSRLEMRVNRIPQSLRQRNLQELKDELAEKAKPVPPPPIPMSTTLVKNVPDVLPSVRQNLKRNSDQISTNGDKENEPDTQSQQDLANPKKRAKTATASANTKASRTASKATASNVLSPRPQNARAPPPRSPLKSAPVNDKATVPKPSSPVKSMAKAAVKAIGRAGSRKKPAEPVAKGRTSGASDTSNGTTVVSRAGVKKTTATRKKAAAPKAPATKKAPAVKKEAVPAKPASGRTLRNRG